MTKKIVTPINMMIYKTAIEYAAVYYEAGRSTGLTSKFKSPEAFAKANIEKFIPLVIKNYIEMLKPTSNCTEEMRAGVYEALMDPVNDPALMDSSKNGLPDINAKMLADVISAYDKNQLKFKDISPKASYKNKLLNTANPFTPKPN